MSSGPETRLQREQTSPRQPLLLQSQRATRARQVAARSSTCDARAPASTRLRSRSQTAGDRGSRRKVRTTSGICFAVRKLICTLDRDAIRSWLPMALFAISTEVTASFLMGILGRLETAVTGRKSDEFLGALFDSLLIVTAVAIQKAILLYVQGLGALRWRKKLVSLQHSAYFDPKVFFKVCQQARILNAERLDNPDQRVSQDTDRLTQNLSQFFVTFIPLPYKVVFYTISIWKMFGWIAPACCFAFFLCTAVPNWLLLRRVVAFVAEQERLEGDFRLCHSRIRDMAESIAFYQGERADRRRAETTFQQLVNNQLRILAKSLPLNMLIQLCDYSGGLLNYIILGISILYLSSAEGASASQIAGLIASGSFACLNLINSFTSILDLATYTLSISAYGHRVQELIRAAETIRNAPSPSPSTSLSALTRPTNVGVSRSLLLRVEQLETQAPETEACGRPPRGLHQPISFDISRGQNVLMMGPSGVGKTTVLRMLAGLRPCHGVSYHINADNVMFAPQRPYVFIGTIMENITYPNLTCARETAEGLLKQLELLGRVREIGWDTSHDWTKLSPGEQQRIAFVRLLIARPVLAILDESTCALPAAMERRCLSMLAQAGSTFLAVSHRQLDGVAHVVNLKPQHPRPPRQQDDKEGQQKHQ